MSYASVLSANAPSPFVKHHSFGAFTLNYDDLLAKVFSIPPTTSSFAFQMYRGIYMETPERITVLSGPHIDVKSDDRRVHISLRIQVQPNWFHSLHLFGSTGSPQNLPNIGTWWSESLEAQSRMGDATVKETVAVWSNVNPSGV